MNKIIENTAKFWVLTMQLRSYGQLTYYMIQFS